MFGNGKRALALAGNVNLRVTAIEALLPYLLTGETPTEHKISRDLSRAGADRDTIIAVTSLAMAYVDRALDKDQGR